ncbi:MAG: MYXO-CTERM sorting domain-containing protein [Planctomycetota bacterium]
MKMIAAAALVAAAGSVSAQTTTNYAAPTFDRWNYPFNFTPGTRTAASTFGAVGIPFTFDDRDAQFLNSFVTAGNYAPGQGASNYVITEATFTATLIDGEFSYDNVRNDGASIELFGTGFRGGLNAFAYGDNFAYGFGDPTSEDIRNAYATDAAGGSRRDVSNEFRDGFISNAFAIGQIAGEVPGTVIGSGQIVTFSLDLTNPDVLAYLQDSLNEGIVSLSVSSTHAASQGGPLSFPVFSTTEGGSPSTFSITAEVIPAPASAAVLGLAGVAGLRRRR